MLKRWRAARLQRDSAQVDRALAAFLPDQSGRVPDCAQRVAALAGLVDSIRPRRPADAETAARRLEWVGQRIANQPLLRAALQDCLLKLFAELRTVHLFTDSGVLANESVLSGLWARIWHKLLPQELDPGRLKDVVGLVFRHPQDHRWMLAVPETVWLDLLQALRLDELAARPEAARARLQWLDALDVLSYRVTALGLEPEIVRVDPSVERYESPFIMQNVELRLFCDEQRRALQAREPPRIDASQLEVLLDQCRTVIARVYRLAESTGASMTLASLLSRLGQNILRIEQLLHLLQPAEPRARQRQILALLLKLVSGENRKNSLEDFLHGNTQLVAQRIVSNAGRAGEKYITETRREYLQLLWSAMGAGLIVAFMAASKLWLGRVPHAPLTEALLYSCNYAGGFLLMHFLHCTLATRQPAMTANRIAHSLDVHVPGRDRLEGVAELIERVVRSQVIAVVGNMLIAVPASLLLAQWLQNGDTPHASPEQAHHLLEQVDPLNWSNWLQAALTGVALFATGLISGFYDNHATYARIPQRLMQRRWLRRLLGSRGQRWLADYVGGHLGGISGSLFFGVMLGSAGALGAISGLPIGTLHVTFCSANTAYALQALKLEPDALQMVRLAAGIAVVGLLNLSVSFGLALWVAMRARRVSFAQSRELLRLVFGNLLRRPQAFLLPPRSVRAAPPPAA